MPPTASQPVRLAGRATLTLTRAIVVRAVCLGTFPLNLKGDVRGGVQGLFTSSYIECN